MPDPASTAADRRGERGFGLDVLGPTVVRVHGLAVPLRRRESDVLTALALRSPHSVTMDDLCDLLWMEPPLSAAKTVQNHVARLRTALGRDCVITVVGGGYRLGPGWDLDVDRFDACFARARRGMTARDFTIGRALLLRALGEVRGVPFADLPASVVTLAERARRAQLILAAEDDEVLGLLATDETALALARASALAETEPYRETRWMLLAIGLYRSGQRRESLRALNAGRRRLLETSGLTVGPALSRLESLILADDPTVARGSPFSLVDQAMSKPLGRADEDVFVGREAQLDDCVGVLTDSADRRSSRSITIRGAEGIGKTAFASRLALRAALEGWDVVWGVCW
ncbi:MAG TPA: BTAD domain-containing putative transcriptional regulator, partial [Ilumatobacteraceae bacterium]